MLPRSPSSLLRLFERAKRFAAAGAVGLALCPFIAHSASAETRIAPAGRGPYKVGSTNYELSPAASMTDPVKTRLLNRTDASGRYIADLLRYPAATETFTVDVPPIDALYGELAGRPMFFSGFVMYPTRDDNTRPDYAFPLANVGDAVFERMESPSDKPIFADPHIKYPMVVISHGGGVHAIYEVSHAKFLASHGYIVACLNHGDGAVDTRRNAFYGLRPLATKAFIDRLLASDRFGANIDRRRIGITGHSWGGLTALATAGAKLFNHPESVVDPRIRAVVGMEPSITNNFGGNYRLSFGAKNIGLKAVRQPYLHINGTRNTLPRQALDLASGSTYSITLPGQPHVFEGPSWSDAHNWELVFFNAYLKDDEGMRELLRTAVSVDGYNPDRQDFDKQRVLDAPPESVSNSSLKLSITFGDKPKTAQVEATFLVAMEDKGRIADLQSSPDGRAWATVASTASSSPAGFPQLPQASDGYIWKTLRDPKPLSESGVARFYRLRHDHRLQL